MVLCEMLYSVMHCSGDMETSLVWGFSSTHVPDYYDIVVIAPGSYRP